MADTISLQDVLSNAPVNPTPDESYLVAINDGNIYRVSFDDYASSVDLTSDYSLAQRAIGGELIILSGLDDGNNAPGTALQSRINAIVALGAPATSIGWTSIGTEIAVLGVGAITGVVSASSTAAITGAVFLGTGMLTAVDATLSVAGIDGVGGTIGISAFAPAGVTVTVFDFTGSGVALGLANMTGVNSVSGVTDVIGIGAVAGAGISIVTAVGAETSTGAMDGTGISLGIAATAPVATTTSVAEIAGVGVSLGLGSLTGVSTGTSATDYTGIGVALGAGDVSGVSAAALVATMTGTGIDATGYGLATGVTVSTLAAGFSGAGSDGVGYGDVTSVSVASSVIGLSGAGVGNTAPAFTQQPTLVSATQTSITFSYVTADVDGDLYSRTVYVNGSNYSSVIHEPPGSRTFTVNSLSTNSAYNIQVAIVGETGNSTTVYSDIVSMATQGTLPSTPTISVTPGDAQNTITWSPASGATSYNIYWTSDGSTPTTGSNKLTNVTSGVVHQYLNQTGQSDGSGTKLSNGIAYQYKAESVNATGQSSLSTVVSATPSSNSILIFTFDGTAGSAIPAEFNPQIANGGTAALDGAGRAKLTTTTTAAAAMMTLPLTAVTGVTKTLKVKFAFSALNSYSPILVFDMASPLPPGDGLPGNYDSGKFRWLMEARIDAGTLKLDLAYRDVALGGASNWNWRWWGGSAWATTDMASFVSATLGTYYWYILELTPTQFRMSIYSAAYNDPAVATGKLMQTAWTNISNVVAISNAPFLVLGDHRTDSQTETMLIDEVRWG